MVSVVAEFVLTDKLAVCRIANWKSAAVTTLVVQRPTPSRITIPSMSVMGFAHWFSEMNPDKPAAQKNGGKIQPSCVVPLKRGLGDGAGRADGGNQSECPKQQVHYNAGTHH